MAEFEKQPALSHVKRLWLHGFVMGFVVVGLILAAWFFLGSAPAPKEEEGKTAMVAPPGPTPAPQGTPGGESSRAQAALAAQLEEVLARLREATLKKDEAQFFSLYSSNFPHLDDRRRRITQTWQNFDYSRMAFRLAQVSPQGPDQALAQVTWQIETRDPQTGVVQEVTRTYRVLFRRESGQWHIAALSPEG